MAKIEYECSWCKNPISVEETEDVHTDIKAHGVCEKCELKQLKETTIPLTKKKISRFEGSGVNELSKKLENRLSAMVARVKELDSKSMADDSLSPISLMRLTEIKDPDELLKDYDRDDISVEEKLDGWKVQAIKKDGEVKIYSRRGEDKTGNFPEIVDALASLPDNTLVEGELVYWDSGKQDVGKVTSLAGSKPETSHEKAKELPGTVKIHLYDVLWHKGKNISKESFSQRRKTLQSAVKTSEKVLLTKQYPFSEWQKAMNVAVKSGGEGIVLKLKDEGYQYKPKGQQEPKPKGVMYKYKGGVGKSDSDDYVVYDYEMSEKGKLKAFFGQYHSGKLYHISEISNFSKEDEETIKNKLRKGHFVIEIGFQERQPGGLRHQKFVRFRDDKKSKDATMHEFHVENIDNFKVAKASFMLSKRASYADEWLKILEKAVMRLYPSGLPQISGVDFPAIYYLVSRLESNNRSDVIGDHGNSFGRTQVHGPYFMRYLARDPRTKHITGLSSQDLKQMADTWIRAKRNLRGVWKQVPVDQDVARAYMANRKLVIRRKEGVTIKRSPTSDPGIIKLRGNRFVGYVIDLNKLRSMGLSITNNALSKLHQICNSFITWGVANSAISKLFIAQKNPVAYAKFRRSFNSRNIGRDPVLQAILDRVSQKDFANKVRIVASNVSRYGYDTSAPGAFNIYQLIFIANASGAGRVQQFLRDKKPFAAGNLHYIQSSRFKRAMKWIQRDPKMPPNVQYIARLLLTDLPSRGGMAGFAPRKWANEAIPLSKRAKNLYAKEEEFEEEITGPEKSWFVIELEDEFFTNLRQLMDENTAVSAIIRKKLSERGGKELEEHEFFPLCRDDIVQYITENIEEIQTKQLDSNYNPFVEYMLRNWDIKLVAPESVTTPTQPKKAVEEDNNEFFEEKTPPDATPWQPKEGRSFLVSKRADYVESGTLYFPGQYADAIKSGKRRMTIRPNDVPVRIDEVVRCVTYSGGVICDVKITAKNVMSINRIGKAYGNRMAKSLAQKFGPRKRFVVIKFEPVENINAADDEDDEEKMSEVLIDKDKKLTRGQIKTHYSKSTIRKKIMSRIKDNPVIVYIGTGTNEKILKRNHDGKEIVITNDSSEQDENPNNYFYWVKRRVLSFHQVFGTKTDLGFVDLDIHGDFPLSEAKKYANEVSKAIKNKYGVGTTIFQSGGSGLHVEFKLKTEISIDKLRGELKKMLDAINEDWDDVTTGVVKGSGMRSDVSTLHNKGSIRVPGSFGESHGNIKKSIGSEQDTAENNYNSGGFGKLYTQEITEPFPDPLREVAPMQGEEPVGSYISYNTTEDGKFAATKGKKILMLVAPEEFYEPEYFIPRKIFTEKYGFDVSVASSGRSALGAQGTKIIVTPMSEVDPADFDSFFVVGGKGMISFSKNKEAQKLLKSFIRQKKPVAMICHGPLLAAEAGAIKGREVTGWPDIVGKIRRAKGTWTGMPIERDGMMFTAVGPEDAENLSLVLAEFLSGEKTPVPTRNELLSKESALRVISNIWKFAADLSDEEELSRLMKEQEEEMEEEREEEVAISEEEEALIQRQRQEELLKRQKQIEKSRAERERHEEQKKMQLEKEREFPELYEDEEEEIPELEGPRAIRFKDIVQIEEEEEEPEVEEKEGLETSKEFEHMLSSVKEELSTMLEDIGDFGESPNMAELEYDEEEDYELTMERAPETIFGVKLKSPTDESDEVLDRWFKKGEIAMPSMSEEAKKTFAIANMKDGASLTRLFHDPLAWEILYREPSLLQNWILPALIMAIGQRWFNNNGSRPRLGTKKFKNVGRTPFGMFDEDDLALLKKGATIEELPSARKYIRMINQLVTKYANYYFSYGYRKSKRNPQGALPIGGYIYKALNRAMTKEIAEVKGFKEVRFPVCAVCKAKQKNEKMILRSMVKVGDKPARWECETCKREYEANEFVVEDIEQKLRTIQDSSSGLHTRIEQDKVALKDLEDEGAIERVNRKIQERAERLTSFVVEADLLRKKRDDLSHTQRILGGQLSVPYRHAWCPNPTCPGRKVPLTSINWDADIWKKDTEGVLAAKLYERYGIKKPGTMEAADEPAAKPVKKAITSAHIPPEWLLDVEFICPHDGIRFTLRDSKYKGHRNLGGFLWEPYRRMEWDTIHEAAPKEIEVAVAMAGVEEKMDAELAKILFTHLSLIGRTIFSREKEKRERKFIDWFAGQLRLHKNNVAKVQKMSAYSSQQREMVLYDVIKASSNLDPLSFVAWLTETAVAGKFVQDKDKDIGQENFILKTTTTQRRDEIYIPILQSWVDKMLSAENGFEHYKVEDMLTNHLEDGLYGDGPGTFFVAKVEDGVLPRRTATKKQEGVFGFKCNLMLSVKFPAKPKYPTPTHMGIEGFEEEYLDELEQTEKIRPVRSAESSLYPRMLRILGVWKLSPGQIQSVLKKKNGERMLDGKTCIAKGPGLHTFALNNQDKNLVGDVIGHDFHVATIEKDETSLSVGDYVLVQALLMPGDYWWAPIRMIQNLRKDSDTAKNIFGRLGTLISDEVSSEEDRRLLQELVQDIKEYGDDPREMEMIVEDLIDRFEAARKKKTSSFSLSVREAKDPLSQYKQKREFDETPEPAGEVSGENKHRFVIQRHKAERAGEHFDLRLENDEGTLSSWSIPKHQLPKGKEKLLAIKTEDHPISYIKFKGEIPEGEYGAGEVDTHDSGTFEEIEWNSSKIVFELKGKKERGTYKLFKTDGKNWMIMEHK